jgi:hypothetical protein
MAVEGKAWEIIDGIPERANWAPCSESESSRRAVDAHHSRGRRGQLFQIAPIDEMNSVADPKISRSTVDESPPIEERRIERMSLDQETGFFRRVSREALHHIASRCSHVGERRVIPDLIVAGQL